MKHYEPFLFLSDLADEGVGVPVAESCALVRVKSVTQLITSNDVLHILIAIYRLRALK